MDITGEMYQISIIVYQAGLKWPLKKRPHAALLVVDGFGKGNREGLHDFLTKGVEKDMNEKMIMVGHQTIGNDAGSFRGAVLAETFQEEGPVFAFEEDVSPVNTPVVDMIVVAWNEWNFTHGDSAG